MMRCVLGGGHFWHGALFICTLVRGRLWEPFPVRLLGAPWGRGGPATRGPVLSCWAEHQSRRVPACAEATALLGVSGGLAQKEPLSQAPQVGN